MSVRISRFEWDEYNTNHLAEGHPEFDLKFLDDVVTEAKAYFNKHFRQPVLCGPILIRQKP